MTLPESENPYGQWVVVNAPDVTVKNFGTNSYRNVIINNAEGLEFRLVARACLIGFHICK